MDLIDKFKTREGDSALRIYDIIERKTQHGELTREELAFFVKELCEGRLPDYQASALIMAIFLNGMTERETADLTAVMADSGDQIDLSGIQGIKVDKHSTGGIGDKTTLVIGPIIVACGGRMAKMSGRGLGYAGGTIDKLESIPGFRVALSQEEFIRNVNTVGMAITGQTANVAPADKKIYALRDVTATVASIPLIASSVMSKKLASGADKLVLDVKMGSGAFIKDLDSARQLAEAMVSIGRRNGRETVAVITNMDRPLGRNVGNLLEVQEAAATLRGQGPEDLTEVCLCLAAQMLSLAGKGSYQDCLERARASLRDGSAFRAFRSFLAAQGGEYDVAEHPEKYYPVPREQVILADRDGYLTVRSAEDIGKASMMLGAGRETKDSRLDYTAGIIFAKGAGDAVAKGEEICRLIAQDAGRFAQAEAAMRQALAITAERPAEEPLIFAKVGAEA